MAIPVDVLTERLRCRENVPLATSVFRCNEMFQEFLALVLPDLESSTPRIRDEGAEKAVRRAAEKAIKEIRTYGFELRKAEAIEKTSARDIDDYSNQQEQIEESIKGVQEEIGALKTDLAIERKKRFNKEIYEEACKDINKYPPHRATKTAIEKLQQDLVILEERRRTVQAVQRLKQKQIALILQSLADVKATVEEGDAEETPTAGALEPVEPDEDMTSETGAEVDGDGDAEDNDDDANAEEDGEVEPEVSRRSRRKRSPSADSDDGAVESHGPHAPGSADDEEMPDAA